MDQVHLYVELPPDDADTVYQDVEIEFEEAGFPISLYEPDDRPNIRRISLYVDTDENLSIADIFQSILEKHGILTAMATEELTDTDWVSISLENLPPVVVDRFVVHGTHDANKQLPNMFALTIDAGQAFGTGHHETTICCLRLLARITRRQRFVNVLDLGTGTAVLAIGAAKSMPCRVLATDIDPVACHVAHDNIARNGCNASISVSVASGMNHRDISTSGPFDLVMANILAQPLEAMARDVCRQVKRGGVVILSGLLAHQRARIVAAYRVQGLRLISTIENNGWIALEMARGNGQGK